VQSIPDLANCCLVCILLSAVLIRATVVTSRHSRHRSGDRVGCSHEMQRDLGASKCSMYSSSASVVIKYLSEARLLAFQFPKSITKSLVNLIHRSMLIC
jgi:hypothetical protein